MNYVFDASCLIYFGKLKILDKINLIEGGKYISDGVYNEVVTKGLERKEGESVYIDKMIKNKIVLIKKPKSLIGEGFPLTIADREVISLAKESNSVAIIDENCD